MKDHSDVAYTQDRICVNRFSQVGNYCKYVRRARASAILSSRKQADHSRILQDPRSQS